jgi:hypothetical protein
MDAPWAVRLQDESPLSLTAVVRGGFWAIPDGGEPFRLDAGDVVIGLGPDHWTIADSLDTAPQVVIHPGQHCTTLDGQSLEEEMHQGVRSWGNSQVGETVMLTGAYLFEGEVSRRLLRALPRFVVLSEREVGSPLIALLGDEIVKGDPGQDAVLDRLLDLLLIAVLRAWFARPEASPPSWYVGQGDPVASPTSWVNRRWRSSPAGGSPSPPTCCATRRPPWPQSPARSATPRRSR